MRFIKTGQDNWTPKAKSGLSREYIHGPLYVENEGSPIRGLVWGIVLSLPFWAIMGWIVL